MAIARQDASDILAGACPLDAGHVGRLDALTDEEITRAAEADPDHPPLTDEELDSMAAARAERLSSR